MSERHIAPAGQWQEMATRAQLWRPVYPLYNSATGEIEWDDAGPATCALVYSEGTDEVEVDTNPLAAGALRALIDGSGFISLST